MNKYSSKKYKLLFETVDIEVISRKSGTLFELIDVYPQTKMVPATGMYQTKHDYTSLKLLSILENNLRCNFNIGETAVVEVS